MPVERRTVNPPELADPVGFSHGLSTRGGRVLWLAGQNGTDETGAVIAPGDLVAQTDRALANVLAVVRAAGGAPTDVVKLHLYVSDVAAYRAARRALGAVWRKHFGRYYPAMMLLGVTGFYEPDALVEIDGYAVIADERAGTDGGARGAHDGDEASPSEGDRPAATRDAGDTAADGTSPSAPTGDAGNAAE